MTRKKTPKKKVEIVFDPQKRKEFLTGFRKRKNERRKRAKEDLERQMKEEQKRIRLEIKDGIKHLKKSYEPLKELTAADKANEDAYEDDDVKVKIVELSTANLAAQRNMLGENRIQDSDEESQHSSESEEYDTSANCIPGMDFDVNKKRKHKMSESDVEEDAGSKPKRKSNQPELDLKTKKDIDHFKKTKILKKLKKSKVFKMKERIDKKANQKKARKDKNNSLKSIPKHLRKNKKMERNNRFNKGRMLNRKQLRKKKESS